METHIPVRYTDTTARCFNVTLSGLKGGHSGQEISKPRANANKLLGRFLFELKEKFPCLLVSLKGGQKHNVIAAGATAVIAA